MGRKNRRESCRTSFNNNDLDVISISFLAFNFRGIIRRTSRERFPYPRSSPMRKYETLVEQGRTRRERGAGSGAAFRIRLTARIISFYRVQRIGRVSRRWLVLSSFFFSFFLLLLDASVLLSVLLWPIVRTAASKQEHESVRTGWF